MRLKRGAQKMAEIDIIPMVDIVFQLIIFFLVATQVKKNEVTQLELPVARNPKQVEAEAEPPMILNILSPEVAKDRKPYVLLGDSYDLAGFRQRMRERKAFYQSMRKEMPVLRVRADKNAEFQQIQDALIACRDVGVWQVRLSSLKKK